MEAKDVPHAVSAHGLESAHHSRPPRGGHPSSPAGMGRKRRRPRQEQVPGHAAKSESGAPPDCPGDGGPNLEEGDTPHVHVTSADEQGQPPGGLRAVSSRSGRRGSCGGQRRAEPDCTEEGERGGGGCLAQQRCPNGGGKGVQCHGPSESGACGRPVEGGGLRVALVADTHGLLDEGTKGVLRAMRASLVLHAGDVGDAQKRKSRLDAEAILREVGGAPGAPVVAVAGNTDCPDALRLRWVCAHGLHLQISCAGGKVEACPGAGGGGELEEQESGSSSCPEKQLELGSTGAGEAGCRAGSQSCPGAGDCASGLSLPGYALLRVQELDLRILLLHVCAIPATAEESALIAALKPQIVVCGHSHVPRVHHDANSTLYINPGSAGPRQFRLPRCCALLELGRDGRQVNVSFLATDPVDRSATPGPFMGLLNKSRVAIH